MASRRALLSIIFNGLLLCNLCFADESEADKAEAGFTPGKFVEPELDLTDVFFLDLLNDVDSIGKVWKKSTARKDGLEESLAKYNGEWKIGTPSRIVLEGDYGLIALSKARHHAIAAKLTKPIDFTDDELVVQYETKYEEGQECGGGYLKLLSEGAEKSIQSFADKTDYTIMFGPDRCGGQSKIHFIIKLKNPKNGTVTEHHAPQAKNVPEFADKKTHLFTLKLKKDNSYEILMDGQSVTYGHMLINLVPSVKPPTQIADPDDKKPEDWDDNEFIVDPEAIKPEDWDENEPKEIIDADATIPSDWLEDEETLIDDPEAEKPADWDEEMDGLYEPRKIANPKCAGVSGCGPWSKPMKENPKYKGKWSPPRIQNPNYKGRWAARLIDNPNYYEVDPYSQLAPVTAIGFELWTMSQNIIFDNIFITKDAGLATGLASQTFDVKKELEKIADRIDNPPANFLQSLYDATEERPWLWAVYVLCILIPVIALSAYCFGRKSHAAPDFADSKKTDEYQPDDEQDELVDDGAVEEEEDPDEPGPSTRRRRGSQASSGSRKNAAKSE